MNTDFYIKTTIEDIKEKIKETEFLLRECFFEENARKDFEKYLEDYKSLLNNLEEKDLHS